MSKNKENKIPILSFFSGGGFMDIGFLKAGFDIVWSNEFDTTFAELHNEGINSWRKSQGIEDKLGILNTKSILDISTNEIVDEAFPNGKPENFGVIGGPPCQDFSMNGSLKGFNGERGQLTIVYIDKILELKPTFFVMENVTGLLKRKATRDFLYTLLKRVESEYYIDYQQLNSLDFGVPQHRERIFFVGIKKENLSIRWDKKTIKDRWFPFPINNNYQNALHKYNWGTRISFGSTIPFPDLPMELCVENCLVSDGDLEFIPNANEFFKMRVSENFLNTIDEGETNRPSFKRLHRYRYSPTACYGNNEVHLHPYKNRRLSVREALRIQGVPDEYILPQMVSMTKKFKMIGNGVPVPLAESVALSLKEFITKNILIV